MTTAESSVARGPLHWSPPLAAPAPRRLRKGIPLAGALVVLLAIAASLVRLPYVQVLPGRTDPVADLLSIEQATTHPPDGRILFTTVSLRANLNAYEALAGWLDNDVDVRPREEIYGDRDSELFREENLKAMRESQLTAVIVAIRRLGYAATGDGARVTSLVPRTPAAASLQVGEVIVDADGTPVCLAEDAVSVVRSKAPGDELRLRVRSLAGGVRDLSLRLVPRPGDAARGFLGVELETQSCKPPFPITIDAGMIGGPSAGLAFTLAVLDNLTPGELTGGKTVAATGTINGDGTIGAVGGVAQKTVAVRESGAAVFLVPKSEIDKARPRAGKLRVEPVETIDDALRVLASLGGNALELGTPGRPGGGEA